MKREKLIAVLATLVVAAFVTCVVYRSNWFTLNHMAEATIVVVWTAAIAWLGQKGWAILGPLRASYAVKQAAKLHRKQLLELLRWEGAPTLFGSKMTLYALEQEADKVIESATDQVEEWRRLMEVLLTNGSSMEELEGMTVPQLRTAARPYMTVRAA